MTYCVGMLLDEGLVMAADTRTNAGVDNVGKFKKLFTWERPGEAVFVLLTAGNLAVTQSALVLGITQRKTTGSEAPRQFDLAPSEIEDWLEQGKAGMGNARRAKPEDIREQYERQLRGLQEAYGEAMLEPRAREQFQSPLGKNEP